MVFNIDDTDDTDDLGVASYAESTSRSRICQSVVQQIVRLDYSSMTLQECSLDM